MTSSTEKLQKVLARVGLGSRREIEAWIAAGRVIVNGRVATVGDRVGQKDQIKLDGRPVKHDSTHSEEHKLLLYNKPTGEICSRNDPQGRPTVFQRLPKLTYGRWISIGRLDVNTTGLLLFTTDGELANEWMHPKNELEREYVVRVLGEVDEAMIKRLKKGVLLDGSHVKFDEIQKTGSSQGANQWFKILLKEGRYRAVRRLFESQGVTVSRLTRIRFGSIQLPRDLKLGAFRYFHTACQSP